MNNIHYSEQTVTVRREIDWLVYAVDRVVIRDIHTTVFIVLDCSSISKNYKLLRSSS